MIDEKVLLLQAEREQRNNDMLLMRSMDKKLGLTRHIVENPMIEINLRIIEYVSMFPFSVEFLMFQTLQDFREHLIIMQAKKLDGSKPVAMLKNEQHTKIFINDKITREDFKAGGVFYFLREEMRG